MEWLLDTLWVWSSLVRMRYRDFAFKKLLVYLALTSATSTSGPTDDAPQPGRNTTAFPTVISSPLGVYNSSRTPGAFAWNTYNYCNAPHVNAAHYVEVGNERSAELVYLNVVMRHHKRTPDNLYPEENSVNRVPWDCADYDEFSYGGPGGAAVYHATHTPAWHPFISLIWNGTCDEGQLTREGLEDAIQHGKDFWSVYATKLGFLRTVNPADIFVRTSTETRTFEVAGGMLAGMDPAMVNQSFPVHNQPSPIDNVAPNYACPGADAIRDAYQSVPAWTDHLASNQTLKNRLDALLGTAGLSAWSTWYDHFFDTFSSRTCHGHPLPCNGTTGVCVSEADAAHVFGIGDWEYNYIWNTAENATTYNQLTFGVFFQELAMNFRAFQAHSQLASLTTVTDANTNSTTQVQSDTSQSKPQPPKLHLTVGHDGSMIRLASGLGLGKIQPLRWPALGSEIVMEVWQEKTGSRGQFVRVLHEGLPVSTLEWVPLESFIQLVQSQVPPNIFKTCTQS